MISPSAPWLAERAVNCRVGRGYGTLQRHAIRRAKSPDRVASRTGAVHNRISVVQVT
jgi:hypothetical protein